MKFPLTRRHFAVAALLAFAIPQWLKGLDGNAILALILATAILLAGQVIEDRRLAQSSAKQIFRK